MGLWGQAGDTHLIGGHGGLAGRFAQRGLYRRLVALPGAAGHCPEIPVGCPRRAMLHQHQRLAVGIRGPQQQACRTESPAQNVPVAATHQPTLPHVREQNVTTDGALTTP